MNLNELGKKIHEGNVKRGFYEDEKNTGEIIALMHSELSEALEADRKGRYCKNIPNGLFNPDDIDYAKSYTYFVKGSFEEEMADVIIRVLDWCAYKGIDIDAHVMAKMAYNETREYKHGKKY